jgi:L-fuconate dehydratase
MHITKAGTRDARFFLGEGSGSDSVHDSSNYAYSVCILNTDTSTTGIGLAFTLGGGNDLVCKAIEYLAKGLEGKEIEELMADFGKVYRSMADSPTLRWLGPHKGVVHLALAAIVNACFDLWAKHRKLPLWKLLLELSPDELANTLDLNYLEEVMTRDDVIEILRGNATTRNERSGILKTGYKGYDTSVGWFNYSDDRIRTETTKAIQSGFNAMKLKVGSDDPDRDIRRAHLIREVAGDSATIMLDANQKWNLPQAISICKKLSSINPYWIEEPTHPDDVLAHQTLATAIAPLKIAAGEHIPNKILFKNFLKAGALDFCQADCVRVGGISEFLTISLLSRKFNIPVVPHVGDMGQIHQHLVLFNHIAMGHEHLFLEHIPHLRAYFKTPARIKEGYYCVPDEAGSSSDLVDSL